MDWLGLAVSLLSAIYFGITATLLALIRLVLSTVRLATHPVAVLWRVLLFVLTPVIHTLRFLLSPLFFVVNNFPRLQPIYIYFGSAAFVGITFGLIFALASSGLISILGLEGSSPDDDHKDGKAASHVRPASSARYGDGYDDEDEDLRDYRRGDETTPPPTKLADFEQESLDALLASLEYPDEDLGSLTRQAWRDSPNTKRRRSAAALRISTILEEDDDSL